MTDIEMPQMSGALLADRLKKTQPELEVLFVTGWGEQALEKYGIENDGVHLLEKPFAPMTLVERVESCCIG